MESNIHQSDTCDFFFQAAIIIIAFGFYGCASAAEIEINGNSTSEKKLFAMQRVFLLLAARAMAKESVKFSSKIEFELTVNIKLIISIFFKSANNKEKTTFHEWHENCVQNAPT